MCDPLDMFCTDDISAIKMMYNASKAKAGNSDYYAFITCMRDTVGKSCDYDRSSDKSAKCNNAIYSATDKCSKN